MHYTVVTIDVNYYDYHKHLVTQVLVMVHRNMFYGVLYCGYL